MTGDQESWGSHVAEACCCKVKSGKRKEEGKELLLFLPTDSERKRLLSVSVLRFPLFVLFSQVLSSRLLLLNTHCSFSFYRVEHIYTAVVQNMLLLLASHGDRNTESTGNDERDSCRDTYTTHTLVCTSFALLHTEVSVNFFFSGPHDGVRERHHRSRKKKNWKEVG